MGEQSFVEKEYFENVVRNLRKRIGAAASGIGAHHTTHELGGSDAIKLDDLSTPDDNTDLDVSITKHGLCPKAPNSASQFLRGDATWATLSAGMINQVKVDSYVAVATFNTGFPNDDTKPQITEGDEIMSCTITPVNASSKIVIMFTANLRYSTYGCIACIFRSGVNDTLLTIVSYGIASSDMVGNISEVAGSTAARTYSIRVGDSTGNNIVTNDNITAKFGDSYACHMIVMEVLP